MDEDKDTQQKSLVEQERIRQERIQQLKDEEARKAIAEIVKARDENDARIRKEQEENFKKNVDEQFNTQLQIRTSPRPTPEGTTWGGPLSPQEMAQLYRSVENQRRLGDINYRNQEREPYNKQIDKTLDEAEKKQRERQAAIEQALDQYSKTRDPSRRGPSDESKKPPDGGETASLERRQEQSQPTKEEQRRKEVDEIIKRMKEADERQQQRERDEGRTRRR